MTFALQDLACFDYCLQFGHAGASAGGEKETASAKNAALAAAGVRVPSSFDELGDAIREVYNDLVEKGVIVPQPEVPPPPVPMDYSWARVRHMWHAILNGQFRVFT